MGENSKIEWCHHSFNPWLGCTKVSPACDHCYAEAWAKRTGEDELWKGERRLTSPRMWTQPIKWNRQAEAERRRFRVFCASMADVFDNQVAEAWRSDLFAMIEDTPHLDWLFLTKRPQNIARLIWPKWDAGLPHNIWLGTTVENQVEAERRIDHLLAVPATTHFLSCEPLLGPLDLGPWFHEIGGIDWVICGGESGPRARPMKPNWARALRDQCKATGVAFFFKQWGEYAPDDHAPDAHTAMRRIGKKAAGSLLDGCEHMEFPR